MTSKPIDSNLFKDIGKKSKLIFTAKSSKNNLQNLSLIHIFGNAKSYIKTGNFFFQDPKLNEALIMAAERGVAIFEMCIRDRSRRR